MKNREGKTGTPTFPTSGKRENRDTHFSDFGEKPGKNLDTHFSDFGGTNGGANGNTNGDIHMPTIPST
jgi:hypothetical protein